MVSFTARRTSDGLLLGDVGFEVFQSGYDSPSEDFGETPRAKVTVALHQGIPSYVLALGTRVDIYRNGAKAFPGIIENSDAGQGQSDVGKYVVDMIHRGYLKLRREICTSYDFDEDGDPATTRDGVSVNTWDFPAYRKAGGTLNEHGDIPVVHAFTVDQVTQALIGSRFLYGHIFEDASHFLASQVYSTTSKLAVYRDGPSGDLHPKLQRTRTTGAGFGAAGTWESIPLMNGSPFVGAAMGTISLVEVTIIGSKAGAIDPTIEVCRNAGDISLGTLKNAAGRTYTAITLTHNANWNGSGLSAWTGSVTLTGSETVKNMLGYKIGIGGSAGDSTTTSVHAIYLEATTTLNTGITEGTIEVYDPPAIYELSTLETTIVETDFLDYDRQEALEILRKTTESDSAVNPSPHWDMYIDVNEAFHFKERRGALIDIEYSFEMQNLKDIGHQYFGRELAYQTIAIGPGTGLARTEFKTQADFTTLGGLYDADRDPTRGGTQSFTDLCQVRKFVDSNESSYIMLLHKARAQHKLWREPQEAIRVDLLSEELPFYDVGDQLKLKNLPTRTSDTPRIVRLSRSLDAKQREKITVELGQHVPNVGGMLNRGGKKAETITIRGVPAPTALGVSGNGIPYQNNGVNAIFAVHKFSILDGRKVKRVFLSASTVPFQALSKSAAGGSGAVVTVPNVAQVVYDNSAPMPPYFGNHQHTDQYNGANQPTTRVIATAITGGGASGNFVFQISVPPATAGSYTIAYGGQNGTSATKTMQFEVRKNSATGTVLATGTSTSLAAGAFVVDWASIPVGPGSSEIAQGDTIYICCVSANFTISDNVQLRIVSNDQHTHSITLPAHTHTLVFGIYQYDGDAGNGTGAVVYAKDTSFSIDPADADSDGIPTQSEFNAKVNPIKFGVEARSQSIDRLDITGWLTADANGTIASKTHSIFFQGLNTAANAQGLGAVIVSVDVELV